VTLDEILTAKKARLKENLYFNHSGVDGYYCLTSQGSLTYKNKRGRDSRVSLQLQDFSRADWQIRQPLWSQ
jgi:hypothetical protein